MRDTLPTDSAERKDVPLARGVLDYFPAALAAVARLSKVGNDKHNPGEDMHHARGKSTDHADCILRHLTERGTYDTDGILHDVKVAWRALALLQETLEVLEGAPLPRGAWEENPFAGIDLTYAPSALTDPTPPTAEEFVLMIRDGAQAMLDHDDPEPDAWPFGGVDLENDPVPSGNFFEDVPFPIGSLVDQNVESVPGFMHGEVISYDFGDQVEVKWWGLEYTKLHDPSELEVREGKDFREDDSSYAADIQEGLMVPQIHSIGPEQPASLHDQLVENAKKTEQRLLADYAAAERRFLEASGLTAAEFIAQSTAPPLLAQQECPNDIQERIAGQTEESRDIKNEYYGVKVPE